MTFMIWPYFDQKSIFYSFFLCLVHEVLRLKLYYMQRHILFKIYVLFGLSDLNKQCLGKNVNFSTATKMTTPENEILYQWNNAASTIDLHI
jgi:hypothetical protein